MLGDVSNTKKRGEKIGKIAISLNVESSVKKEKKREPFAVFAGGAAGDNESVSLSKLSKEIEDCFAEISKSSTTLHASKGFMSLQEALADERRSPDCGKLS